MNKAWLRPGLLVLAFSVWGLNGYRFVQGVKQADEVAPDGSLYVDSGESLAAAQQWQSNGWTYDADHRDPFKSRIAPKPVTRRRSRPKSRAPVVKNPPVRQPSMRLLGVVADQGGSLALLETSNRQTYFARVGDAIDEVTVVAIDSSQVVCEFDKRKFVLSLR